MKSTITKTTNQADKNFGLSPKEFEQMVEQMRSGNYQLYEQVFLKHFQSCVDYVMFRCKAEYAEAYDSSMDAMLDLCRRIKLGRIQYGNLRFLFTRVACQYCNQRKKESQVLEELDGIEPEPVRPDVPEDLLDILEESLERIDEPCKSLLQQFYFYKQSLKELAALAGRTEVALRKQKQRCLAGLRSLFMKKYNA